MEKTELVTCPLRNQDNGNCSPLGGFCNHGTEICMSAKRAYEIGFYNGAKVAMRRAPPLDDKALTCDGCECEEGQRPSRCRSCMRYGDRVDNYRRPPEKGE